MVNTLRQSRGFTLIEVMMSVAIFTIIVTFGLSALLISNDSYKRARSESRNVDTLAFVLESMARRIRTGSQYDCNPSTSGLNCTNINSPGFSFQFVDQDGNIVLYSTVSDFGGNYYLQQTITPESGATVEQVLTDPSEIILEEKSLQFMVFGAEDGDIRQPRVTMWLTGQSQFNNDTVPFSLQTTVTQRAIQEQQ